MAGATVITRRGPHDDLPKLKSKRPLQFDRLIMSGSRTSCLDQADWITNLDDLVRKTLDDGKPILGVCYGHQTLARVLGGRELLRKSLTSEVGWTLLRQTSECVLTQGLPQEFYSFSSHFEEVHTLPEGTQHILSSQRCTNQGFQLKGRPVFGIQFHPEKTRDEAVNLFKEINPKTRPDLKDAILHYNKTDQFYSKKVGETIFSNFLNSK